MAAALSRALKLPGKKGSELGEYDPLTQADSEDESEDDDLVLNYPRNGLGRSSCLGAGSSDLRGGRAGRLVAGADEEEEEEEQDEEEEEEWRERLPGKTRQEREGGMASMQYWSQRESGRDGGGGGEGGGGGGGGGEGAGSADPDGKKARMRGAVRTALFLVPLVCAALLVLLCAFLLPCQRGEPDRRPPWERELGEDAGGVTVPRPLALWDVDGDSVEDVLIGVTERTDHALPSASTGGSRVHSVVALSAVGGTVLWRTALRESAVFVQCGLQYEAHPVPLPAGGAALRAYPQTAPLLSGQRERASGPVCLISSSLHLSAINGTTGKKLWSVSPGGIQSQAVPLPDLQGDTVPDLLIATLPADQVSDVSLALLSGLTGDPIGHPLTFNLTGQGTLIGPLLHETQMGAHYILFGLGTVEALSLQDIYTQATGKTPASPSLRLKDSSWERLKKSNSSSLIHITSGSEQVQYLLPLVSGLCNNLNSLDVLSGLNSSRSDWVLVRGSASSRLSVLRERDAHTQWTFDSPALHSRPAPGHFNDDGVPDLLIQSGANGVRKIQVVDGARGRGLWAAEFVCPDLHLEGYSVATTSGQSAFLFWAGDLLQSPKNVTKATMAPAEPVVRKLFLLYPAYPTILLELTSTTDKVLSAAVSYQEQQKDASYISVSSRPAPGQEPGTRVVRSLSLRAAIAAGKVVRLGESAKGPARPGAFEINKFFRRLSFKQQ